jgi:hypothetical protein
MELAFKGELKAALLLHVFVLRLTHLGLFLVWGSNPLCPCGWGFMKIIKDWAVIELWYVFLTLDGGWG